MIALLVWCCFLFCLMHSFVHRGWGGSGPLNIVFIIFLFLSSSPFHPIFPLFLLPLPYFFPPHLFFSKGARCNEMCLGVKHEMSNIWTTSGVGQSHVPIMGPRTELGHLRSLGSESAVSGPTHLSGHMALQPSDLLTSVCYLWEGKLKAHEMRIIYLGTWPHQVGPWSPISSLLAQRNTGLSKHLSAGSEWTVHQPVWGPGRGETWVICTPTLYIPEVHTELRFSGFKLLKMGIQRDGGGSEKHTRLQVIAGILCEPIALFIRNVFLLLQE